jgi:hypothetical protein
MSVEKASSPIYNDSCPNSCRYMGIILLEAINISAAMYNRSTLGNVDN